MKKIFSILTVLLLMVGCTGSSTKSSSETAVVSDGVEVLYFHSKNRCITCNAIESLTKEVVEQDFAEALGEGDIRIQIIDLSTPEGEALANRYEVAFPALYVNSWHDGKEERHDLTKEAFSYAKNSPEQFKTIIEQQIQNLLP